MLRGLAKLGEPSQLAGIDCGNVTVERNVDVVHDTEAHQGFGNLRENVVTTRRTVASIASSYRPTVSQVLNHPDGRFVLDHLLEDNGAVARFVVTGG